MTLKYMHKTYLVLYLYIYKIRIFLFLKILLNIASNILNYVL